eukprot:CAMPEP_0168559452 /NCGR_PEP_ID=MMETSP0413-20121227/10531_1 /TAXON_ID=136452 /ORGANISM="Filamoeba nolandi, Strain NC-AS-23-1" /LENGTH=366 /DNA_ID=CAMNT_0008590681 /DNA_START=32 /DNA_END=1132 /DNA_ORIENTATION=+
MESSGEPSETKEEVQNRSNTPKRTSKKQSESREPEDISNDDDEEESDDYSEEESPNESSNNTNHIVDPPGGSAEGPSLVRSHNQELSQPTRFEFVGVQPEKKGGRRKINIEFIENKSRRHVTFSKRKSGLIKKAYELSTLTGTQVLLLVASETGNVYTFATPKLQPLITNPEGKAFIQSCLNPEPEPLPTPSTSSSATSSTNNRTQPNPHSLAQRDSYAPPSVSSMAHSQNVVNYYSPEGSPKKLPERRDGSGTASAGFQFPTNPLSVNAGNNNSSHPNSTLPNGHSRNSPLSTRTNPNNIFLSGLNTFPRPDDRHPRQAQSVPFPANLLGSSRGINFPQNFHPGNSLLANLQSSYDPVNSTGPTG